MYGLLDLSTANSGLGTPLRSGGQIINDNFLKLHAWMQSRANIAAYSIPTLAAGGPAYLLAVEFSPGNPMPLTVYGRRGSAPTDTTNPGYVRSVDGQWWELAPSGGKVYIEQFGGKADSDINGTPATDNRQPLYDACHFGTWGVNPYAQRSLEIQFGSGHHYYSDTIEFHTCVTIRGVGGGFEGTGSTFWHFPQNKTFIIFGNNATIGETATTGVQQGESAGSTLEGLVLYGKTTRTDHARAGIHVRARVTLRGIGVISPCGDGIRLIGSTATGTIADATKLEDCSVSGFTRNGLYIDGNDANVCHISNFSVHGGGSPEQGCGISDYASFGNKYDNIHVAGYGARGVRYNGRIYLLITYSGEKFTPPGPGPGETTTPGTNDLVWYDFGDFNEEQAAVDPYYDALYPPWSATPTVFHRPQIPVLTNGVGHVFDNLYVEGSLPCHMPGATLSFGGTHDETIYSNHVNGLETGVYCRQGFGAYQRYLPGSPGYQYNGGGFTIGLGAPSGSEAPELGPSIFSHYRQSDGAQYRFRYLRNDLIYNSLNAKTLWQITTTITTETLGRDAPQPHQIIFSDLALRDPADGNTIAMLGIRWLKPTTGSHAAGEFFFSKQPFSYGCAGYMCYEAGTPGKWAQVPLVGLPSVNPQNNGELVFECTSNTQFKVKYKGSDGVVRSGTLTLS